MLKAELFEVVANGENSGVEFKRDVEVLPVAGTSLSTLDKSRLSYLTVSKMVAGQRSPRNTLIMEILRDYGYVDARGMGVRTKVIPLMRNINQADPVFEATEDYLKTILYRKRAGR
jgi:predicted transcriptional regulator